MRYKIEKSEILENIFLLRFENQLELTSTFLRFQEHYESPRFRGKVFTLDEYKDWYTKGKDNFSYYTDWNGFNIPSNILLPFIEGKFNPLSEKESRFLDLFKENKHPLYIVGIHNKLEPSKQNKYLKHEIAHGLFYMDSEYKKKVQKILSQYDLTSFKNWLKSTDGYHDDVFEDECQAYSLAGNAKLPLKIPVALIKSLEEVFNETINNYNFHF